MLPEFLASPVESQAASTTDLYVALLLLGLTFIVLTFHIVRFVRSITDKYSLRQSPFSSVLTIVIGLLLVNINEIIILASIIITDQETTYLGREKAIFIVMGLGFFIYGWTRLLLFNFSLPPNIARIVGLAFLGAMTFYAFAVVITVLITFQVVHTTSFIGIGYQTAVQIYGGFLLIDLIAVILLANSKRKQSKYQAWIGFLMFSALLLNFLSIIFNAIPLIIVNQVEPQVHVFFNYIVEPAMYLLTNTFSLLFLYWVLFNPEWLYSRSLEADS